MQKEKIFEYVKNKFGSDPEYLWKKYPDYAVFRNRKNHKWYAILMKVSKEKLGFFESGSVDILNVKCDPLMISDLINKTGFLPAYHMNKEHWISIMIGSPNIPESDILNLIFLSYDIVNQKNKRFRDQRECF